MVIPDNDQDFQYPSTRYSGSKRRLLDWIWEHIRDIHFLSVLDVFGGTGSVSLMFKKQGKRVNYNDIMEFNQIIGKAIIENGHVRVTDDEVEAILDFPDGEYPNFIQQNFSGIFFTDEENDWLDKVITGIQRIENQYKRAILLAALFQACLAKRPFNLFHRANLYVRTANVSRSFGNKTTWEHPFQVLFKRYVEEYNRAVFSNEMPNQVIGGFDALKAPNGVDLVYLDPPYFSAESLKGVDYMLFYHFLEGLSDYTNWPTKIMIDSKIKRIASSSEILHFTHKSQIPSSFNYLVERFQDNKIVLSYHDDGIPSKEEIWDILKRYKQRVHVFERPFHYALSPNPRTELLFVAE
jgi:adenine-specific DNA-methyltransferase